MTSQVVRPFFGGEAGGTGRLNAGARAKFFTLLAQETLAKLGIANASFWCVHEGLGLYTFFAEPLSEEPVQTSDKLWEVPAKKPLKPPVKRRKKRVVKKRPAKASATAPTRRITYVKPASNG